jgi:hypothetical protein
MPDRHCMVDIETLDTQISAAIVSIGAVVFDPRGEDYQETFSLTIDEKSNRWHGRTVSDATLEWWAQQPSEARERTFGGPHTELSTAMRSFTGWLNALSPTCTRIWAQDPDFDVAILAHCCRMLDIIWPFKFWESRSCRTAKELAYPEGNFPPVAMNGYKHDALADAKAQVIAVQHSFYVLDA